MKTKRFLVVLAFVLVVVGFGVRFCLGGKSEAPSSTVFQYEYQDNDLSLNFYQAEASTAPFERTAGRDVKNVIFLIGDGMSAAQVTATRQYVLGMDERLCIERMPVVGLMWTHSSNAVVTDSAASATALACGYKTNNGKLGLTPDGQPVTTILEALQVKGLATGLVATSAICHATPAGFGSHVEKRSQQPLIAEQLIENKINVLLGGGTSYFLPKGQGDSKREDDKNIIEQAKQAGYRLVENKEQMKASEGDLVLGLFAPGGMTTEDPEPSLAQMTTKAIELLSAKKDKGFFLMVEGSQIDWRCHGNDFPGMVRQVLLFDQAVRAAMAFAVKDGKTLILITGDHETGGLAILKGTGQVGQEYTVGWATKGHSGAPLPVYAFGPGSEDFTGLQDSTEIPTKIARLFNIQDFPRKK